MKIKLNKNIEQKLKLSESNNSVNEADVGPGMSPDSSSTDDLYAAYAKLQYINNQKRGSILVDITMPTSFSSPVKMPVCPLGLRALMTLQMPKKFKNIHGMMLDPKGTYDHATDIALSYFHNVLDVSIGDEISRNKEEVASNESFNFKGAYNNLYEAGVAEVVALSATAGTGVGILAGTTFASVTTAVLSCTAAATIISAPFAATLYGLGYLGELAGNDIDDEKGTNNKELQAETKLLATAELSNTDSDKNWCGDNAIEAINGYIEELTDAVGALLGYIAPDKSNYDKFVNEVNSYISTDDKAIHTYLQANNALVKKAQQEEEEQLKRMILFKENNTERINMFNSKVDEVFYVVNDVKKILLSYEVKKDFNYRLRYSNPKNRSYINAYTKLASSANTTADDYIKLYNEAKLGTPINNIADSIDYKLQYDDYNSLNEADTLEKPLPIDGNAHYTNIKGSLRPLMQGMFPLLAGANIPGVAEAKSMMEQMKAGATAEITAKIESVCKTQGSGQTTNAPARVAQFLNNHPMQAATLTNLWKRHETDLLSRMNTRLLIMTDYGDKEGVLGWAASICKDVVPEVFARALTLRYVMYILKEEGYYTYTPARYKEDEKYFNENKKLILKNINFKFEWLLINYGKQYTSNEGDFIKFENNEYKIINDLQYASFLIMNLQDTANFNSYNNFNALITNAELLANAKSNKSIDINALCMNVSALINQYRSSLLNDDNIEKLAETFLITVEQEKAKLVVKEIFNNITSIELTEDLNKIISRSYFVIINGKADMLDSYMKNKSKISELRLKYDGAEDENEKQEIIKEIDAILGDRNDENTVTIDWSDMFNAEGALHDYYAFIVSRFSALLLNVFDIYKELNIKNDIEKVAHAVEDYVNCLKSGDLLVGLEFNENDVELNNIVRFISAKMPDNMKTLYIASNGNGDEFDKKTAGLDQEKIANTFNESLSNPTKAIDYNGQTMPSGFTGYDSLMLSDAIRDFSGLSLNDLVEICKDDNSLMFKEKISDSDQKSLIEQLKNIIKYLIDYSIASAETPNTISTEKIEEYKEQLKKCVNDETSIDDIKTLYLMSDGKADDLDKKKIDVEKVKTKIIELFKNPQDAIADSSVFVKPATPTGFDFTGSDSIGLSTVKDNIHSIYDFAIADLKEDTLIKTVAVFEKLKSAVKSLIDYVTTKSEDRKNVKDVLKSLLDEIKTADNSNIGTYIGGIYDLKEYAESISSIDDNTCKLIYNTIKLAYEQLPNQFSNRFNSDMPDYKISSDSVIDILSAIKYTTYFSHICDGLKNIKFGDKNFCEYSDEILVEIILALYKMFSKDYYITMPAVLTLSENKEKLSKMKL